MDRNEAISCATEFINKVLAEFSPQEIILYGSYASGTERALSDIDVAVVFDEYAGNHLEGSERLWEMAWNTKGYIEPVLIDLRHDVLGFFNEVKKHGIVLYNAET